MGNDAKYFGVLLEDIRDQNKAVLEAVSDIREQVAALPTREDFNGLSQDVKVVKAAVTDMSKEQNDLVRRVSQLEPL